MSADGTKVAFESNLAGLVPEDGSNNADIFVKDTTSGEIELVSVPLPGSSPSGQSFSPSISADGRKVAFVSSDPNLVTGDSNGFDDVFMRDLQGGTTTLVSAALGGGAANGASDIGGAMISADGSKVAFGSHATNLVLAGPNQDGNIFLRDLVSNSISPPQAGRANTTSAATNATRRVMLGDPCSRCIGYAKHNTANGSY